MQLSEVPHSTAVIATADFEAITRELERLMGDTCLYFYGYDRIEGATRSGRILFLQPREMGVRFPNPMQPSEMAEELKEFLETARFEPKITPRLMLKGYELRDLF